MAYCPRVPAVIALIWGVLMSRRRGASLAGVIASSSLPIVLFVFLAGAFLREGFLCVLMALPLFIGVGVIGSILGWLADKAAGDKSPRLLSVALVAPFMLATVEDRMPVQDAVRHVTATIDIQARPERVWQDINFPTDIRREELAGGWAYRMGVPYPMEARTLEPRVGGVRELRWERGVRFQEEITRYEEKRAIGATASAPARSRPARWTSTSSSAGATSTCWTPAMNSCRKAAERVSRSASPIA